MLRKLMTVLLLVTVVVGTALGATCPIPVYTVEYSCGDGTVAGTLPSNATATYGESFTPTMLTQSHCAAPNGYRLVGIEIWDVDGDIGGYATNVSTFTYYYTTGITIKAHYVPLGGSDNGSTIWNLRSETGVGNTSDNSAMTWSVDFSDYGTISGIATCSDAMPQNTGHGSTIGYIADDPKAITDKDKNGQYCYCKMTEPYFAGSPWVFHHGASSASGCASNCARDCAFAVQYDTVLRASVLRGARPN